MSELEVIGIRALIKQELEGSETILDMQNRLDNLENGLTSEQLEEENEGNQTYGDEDYPDDEEDEPGEPEEEIDEEIQKYQEIDQRKNEERERALNQLEQTQSGSRVDKTLIKKIQGHSHIAGAIKGAKEFEKTKFKDRGFQDDDEEEPEEEIDEDLKEFENRD